MVQEFLTPRPTPPPQRPHVALDAPIESVARDLEAGLGTILDHSPSPIFVKRVPDWRYLLINRSYEELFRVSRETHLGKLDEDLFPPEMVAKLRSVDEQVLATGQPRSAEEVVLLPDGSRRTFLASKFPLRNSKGEIYAVGGIATDITEHRRAEAAVRALVRGTAGGTGVEFLRSLVQELGRALGARWAFVGKLAAPGSRRIRTLALADSGRIQENFEYDLAGTPCAGVFGRTSCIYPTGVADRFPEDLLLRQMGVEAYLGTPISASDGSPLGLLVALHDRPISSVLLNHEILDIFAARAGAELERIESEARWRSVVEHAPEHICKLDHEGRILFLNHPPGGTPPESWIEKPIAEFLSPTDPAALERALRDVRTTGEARSLAIETAGAPGSRKCFDVRIGPIREASGIQELILIAVDVTARRRLEDQLQQASKMEAVGRLAGGIAHDFNNLLTVIQGRLAMQEDLLPANSPARTHAAEALEAARRATDLTRQLLTFSRTSLHSPVRLDLSAAVLEQEPMLRRLIGEHIRLEVRTPDGPCWIRCDPTHIQQVLMNLSVNARDAMGSGGALTLVVRRCTHEERPGVGLEVTDTGTGIPPDILPRIFEPFFTTKEAGQGTGLGLATVHGVVQRAGGTIEVRSEPGHGTSFTLCFPPAAPDPVAPVPAPLAAPPRRGQESILVVEDEESVRTLLHDVLAMSGYRVMTAEDGASAIRALERPGARFDLLLTDIVMPGLNGRQVAERARDLVPSLRVLFVSGYTDDDIVVHGVQASEIDLLQKPFKPQELLDRVRSALDASARTGSTSARKIAGS